MRLDELEVYQEAMWIGEVVWGFRGTKSKKTARNGIQLPMTLAKRANDQ
jgi:hypothetical protein